MTTHPIYSRSRYILSSSFLKRNHQGVVPNVIRAERSEQEVPANGINSQQRNPFVRISGLEAHAHFTSSAPRPPVACGNTGLHPVPPINPSAHEPVAFRVFRGRKNTGASCRLARQCVSDVRQKSDLNSPSRVGTELVIHLFRFHELIDLDPLVHRVGLGDGTGAEDH